MVKQQFFFIDPDRINKPRNGVASVYIDCWWSVDSEGRVALYSNGRQAFGRQPVSPQCNTERAVAERLSARLGFISPVQQLPVVYLAWTEPSGPCLLPTDLEHAVKKEAA